MKATLFIYYLFNAFEQQKEKIINELYLCIGNEPSLKIGNFEPVKCKLDLESLKEKWANPVILKSKKLDVFISTFGNMTTLSFEMKIEEDFNEIINTYIEVMNPDMLMAIEHTNDQLNEAIRNSIVHYLDKAKTKYIVDFPSIKAFAATETILKYNYIKNGVANKIAIDEKWIFYKNGKKYIKNIG